MIRLERQSFDEVEASSDVKMREEAVQEVARKEEKCELSY
jgi:hypothetical protein